MCNVLQTLFAVPVHAQISLLTCCQEVVPMHPPVVVLLPVQQG